MVANRWTILGILFIARTSVGFQFQSVASVSPALVDDLSIGYAQVGTLIGAYMLPGVVIALPGGFLSSFFGDKRMALAGLLLMIVGGAVTALAGSYGVVLMGRLISGTGGVLFNVVLTKMVVDWFADKEIVSAMGVLLASWPMGIALGMVIYSPLVNALSWPWAVLASVLVSALALVLVAGFYTRPPSAEETARREPMRLSIPMRELVPICLAGVAWAAFNVGFAVYFSFGPDLLIARGSSSIVASSLVSVGVWVTMLSVPVGGYLAERSGHAGAVMVVFSLLAGVALALFPVLSIPLLLSVLIGLVIGPSPGAMVGLPAAALSARSRGLGLGIFYTLYYAGVAVGPALAGFSRDLTERAEAPLLFGSAMFVAAALFLFTFVLYRRNATVSTLAA